MENGCLVRVLVLDGDRASGLDRMDDVAVQATFEGRAELYRPDGGYKLSQSSLDLAAAATSAVYDAVIIGNNEGFGRLKAAQIAANLRSRTLIVWNHHDPDDEATYRSMGYTRFGQRYSREGEWPLGVTEFIREVAIEIYGE